MVGLYLNPPENAIVLSIDEKSQIQALDRRNTRCRCNPGRPRNVARCTRVRLAARGPTDGTDLAVEVGLVLEDATSGFCGAVLRWERGLVILEDRHGNRRTFALGAGFWYEGSPAVRRRAGGEIWGDVLRHVGVVVEYLGGIDDLPRIVADFAPAEGRRLGVLVDHLVPRSKESQIASRTGSEAALAAGTCWCWVIHTWTFGRR